MKEKENFRADLELTRGRKELRRVMSRHGYSALHLSQQIALKDFEMFELRRKECDGKWEGALNSTWMTCNPLI
mgnify:FL=1